MRKLHFIQADVFSDSPFGGNSVVVVPQPGPITSDEMQKLARGTNFAETAFVVPPTDESAAFALRCYTPTTEVTYSGHQLLGAAYVLATMGRWPLKEPVTELRAQIGEHVSTVRINVSEGQVTSVWFTERPAEFGERVDNFSALAAALSVEPIEILHTGLPVQVVRTDLTCLIVPVQSLSTVRDLMPVTQAIDEVLNDLGAACVLVYAPRTLSPRNDVHVRVFAPSLGIEEDPATGTANGALAAYLVRHGAILARPHATLRSEQGSETGRPSLIEMEIDGSTDPPTVQVGGRVSRSVEGSVFY